MDKEILQAVEKHKEERGIDLTPLIERCQTKDFNAFDTRLEFLKAGAPWGPYLVAWALAETDEQREIELGYARELIKSQY